MTQYAKGEKPRDLDAATGGLVLARHRNFMKDEDDAMHPLGTGLLGPVQLGDQDYAKNGKTDKVAKRTGDKSAKAVKPRS